MSARLTDAERAELAIVGCSRHGGDAPGVFICRPCADAGDALIERILTERMAQAWEEGNSAGWRDSCRVGPFALAHNPYRHEAASCGVSTHHGSKERVSWTVTRNDSTTLFGAGES
jgi:hypothetical protein